MFRRIPRQEASVFRRHHRASRTCARSSRSKSCVRLGPSAASVPTSARLQFCFAGRPSPEANCLAFLLGLFCERSARAAPRVALAAPARRTNTRHGKLAVDVGVESRLAGVDARGCERSDMVTVLVRPWWFPLPRFPTERRSPQSVHSSVSAGCQRTRRAARHRARPLVAVPRAAMPVQYPSCIIVLTFPSSPASSSGASIDDPFYPLGGSHLLSFATATFTVFHPRLRAPQPRRKRSTSPRSSGSRPRR